MSEDATPAAAPAEQAPTAATPSAAAAENQELMQQMVGLQRLMAAHEVNLREQPMEVRQAVAADLQARAINAQVGGALQITDPKQIQDVIAVLQQHGLLPRG